MILRKILDVINKRIIGYIIIFYWVLQFDYIKYYTFENEVYFVNE
jgi:hypothetical protein